MSLPGTTTSTPNDSDHQVELITQLPLEDTEDIRPILMELDTEPRKRKESISSDDTNEPPNVTPTRKLRPQKKRSLDGARKKTCKDR